MRTARATLNFRIVSFRDRSVSRELRSGTRGAKGPVRRCAAGEPRTGRPEAKSTGQRSRSGNRGGEGIGALHQETRSLCGRAAVADIGSEQDGCQERPEEPAGGSPDRNRANGTKVRRSRYLKEDVL